MNNKTQIIITGVTSFLGSNLAKYLLNEGYEVFGIARPNSKNISHIDDLKNKLNILYIDLAKENIEDYKKILSNCKNLDLSSKCIFLHLAWDSASKLGRYDKELQKSNFDSSKKAIYLSKLLNAQKFIFTSSQAEDNNSPYGVYKKQFSEYGKNNIKNFVHLRIFSVYGSNDYHNTLITYLVDCFKNNKEAVVGKCEHNWNYLHVEDFCKILEKFIISDNIDYNLTYDIASDDTKLLKNYIDEFINKYKVIVLYDRKEYGNEKFAIPNIENTKKVIGENYKFIKFMDKYEI